MFSPLWLHVSAVRRCGVCTLLRAAFAGKEGGDVQLLRVFVGRQHPAVAVAVKWNHGSLIRIQGPLPVEVCVFLYLKFFNFY